MNPKDFDELYQRMHSEEMEIGRTKGCEYASDVDRLDNFKRLGAEIKCPHCGKPVGPFVILWVYLKKHMDAILHYINHQKALSEPPEGRIKDSRVFLGLLRGLIQETEEHKN